MYIVRAVYLIATMPSHTRISHIYKVRHCHIHTYREIGRQAGRLREGKRKRYIDNMLDGWMAKAVVRAQ